MPAHRARTKRKAGPIDTSFTNPFWFALTANHAAFALGSLLALRYPADVIPLAAVELVTHESLAALQSLLIAPRQDTPGESIYLTGDLPANLEQYGLILEATLPCWQMHADLPRPAHLPSISVSSIRPLTLEDAPAMVALTDLAFPGFFRPSTCLLGRYFGIHHDGVLVAMAGERAAFGPCRELSAVCTHPGHTGRGFAAHLIQHLLQIHAAHDERSFLHVSQSNHRAIALYQRLGFTRTAGLSFNRLRCL